MGELFLARHGLSGFEKLVVVKKVLPQLAADSHFIERFTNDAQVAVQLQHANIAQVFEVGRVGDEYFLAIEYIDGRDLRRTLAGCDGGLPVELALLIARDVTSGLTYAHRRTNMAGESLKLVHCDVSPPNIMLSFEGETKLIDFGIARTARKPEATDDERGFGKFGYMSPEQLVRGRKVDFRTDIYATGVVLFEMLTGERLYSSGDTPDHREVARMVATGQHALPSHHDPVLAPYDELVGRALAPQPEDRYPTAAAFRDAIQQCLVAVNPAISPDRLGTFMRTRFASELAHRHSTTIDEDLVHQWQEELTERTDTVLFAFADGQFVPTPVPAPEASTQIESAAQIVQRRRPRPGLVLAIGLLAGFCIAGIAVAIGLKTGEQQRVSRVAPVVVQAQSARVTEQSGAPRPVVRPLSAPALKEPLAPQPADAGPKRRTKPGLKKTSKPAPPTQIKKSPDKKLSEASVRSKFKAVSREYRRYKQNFGPRLDSEWTALANYATFAKGPEKLGSFNKKLDRFRARMRRARD